MDFRQAISGAMAGIALLVGMMCSAAAATTRHYYVAAEDVEWDFAPSNQNLMHCHDPEGCPIPDPWTDSHIFNKTRYIEYTDPTFTERKPTPEWLGVLGPTIRAEEGDTVMVHFCNHSIKGSFGMHPHGFRYDKDNEGAHYQGAQSGQPAGAGSQVAPGEGFTYNWRADGDSAPALGDPSSKVWWYHSHINEPAETNLGLLGPIIITKKGMARSDGSPRDVDREFVTAFVIFNELPDEPDPEPGLTHSINGYIFGNLTGLVMHNGEKVRWHVLGMGNEVDNHTPHWHGKTVTVGAGPAARRTEVAEIMPASMLTADMNANNPGEWMYHCHVADHIDAGMMASYVILP
jgi:manganese oxidase